MEIQETKKIISILGIFILLGLTFLILKSIILSIVSGLLLAYIFSPVYDLVNKRIKKPNLTVSLIFLVICMVIIIPLFFLIPFISRQVIDFYLFLTRFDPYPIISRFFPMISNSPEMSTEVYAYLTTFTADLAKFVLSGFQKLFLNLPSFFLQTSIILFTFYFALRDKEKLKKYVLNISPFSQESGKRFYNHFKQVTNSVIYGQVITGIAQGITATLGFFIFGLNQALLLGILATLMGILPVIGPVIVWLPAAFYLLALGKTFGGVGLLIYGTLVISSVDNLIRPLVVSKMAKMHTAIALIGMVGGLYAFGVVGLVIGPLTLEYLFLIIEFYKEGRFS